MSWCCASVHHLSSSDDRPGEETSEVVVEKLAIKSIPLLPQDRYSRSSEGTNLKCWYPWQSSQTCTGTQTPFEMHHFQTLMVQNYISDTSSVSSFTKLEKIQDLNKESTAYLPYHQDKEIMGCTTLFTRVPSSTEQHQMSEDTSNSNCRQSIHTCPDNESFIYKPSSDDSSKKASISIDDTIVTAKHVLSSNLFHSSEEILYTEELECRTNSTLEEQDLTPNTRVRSTKITSKLLNKQKLSDTQSLRQPVPQSAHEYADECSNSTDEVCVTSSNGTDPVILSTPATLSQSRRNKSTSTSNGNILQQSDSTVDVKAENQEREIKSFESLKFLESQSAPEVPFQQNIADDKELNEEKPVEQNLIQTTVETKSGTKNEIEKSMEPLSDTEIMPIESVEDLEHSDMNIENDQVTWSLLNERHPTYIHSRFFNKSTIQEKQLPPPKLEPMPTFIGLSTKCNVQPKKVFTPQHLSIFLVAFIKKTLKAKSFQSASSKNAQSSMSEATRSLQTKHVAKQHNIEKNKSTVIWQVQQNKSTCSNIKRKLENQLQYPSNLTCYSDGSSKAERHCVEAEYQEINPNTIEKTLGDYCSKEAKTATNEKLNNKDNLEKKDRIISTPREKKTDSQIALEDDNYSNTSTTSLPDKICHFSERRFVQTADSPSKCARGLNISKEGIQSRTKHSKCATSRKGLKKCLDHQSLSERNNEPSTSVFKEEYTSTTELTNLSSIPSSETFHTPGEKFVQVSECPKCALRKQAIQSRQTHRKHAPSRKDPDLLNNSSLSNSEQSTSTDEFIFKECINTVTFERSTTMNPDLEILANECNPVYLGDIERDQQNTLQTERCKFPIKKRLYYNSKEIHEKHTKLKDASLSKKFPATYYNIQRKQQQFMFRTVSPQVKNPEDDKLIKTRTSRITHKDSNKTQSDSNKTTSCITKSDTHCSDNPLSASSCDDHSGIGGPQVPISNLSEISQMATHESQEETLLWTIIIKNVDPEELCE